MSKKTSENKKRRLKKKGQQPKPVASPASGPGPKLKKREGRSGVFVDRSELPVHYDRTGISLIARDPSSVYAYWEISPPSLWEAKATLGDAYIKSIQTLRILDITGINFNGSNAKGQFDIDLDPKTQSRYILLPNDNATVCADLGLKTAEGVFYFLARSNVVSTPSANESDCMETTWAKVKHKQGSKPYVVAQTFSFPQKQESAVQAPKIKTQTGEYEEEAGMTPAGNAEVLHTAAADAARGDQVASPSAAVRPEGAGEGAQAAPGGVTGLKGSEIAASFTAYRAGASEKTRFLPNSADRSLFSADIAGIAEISSAASGGGGSEHQRLREGKDFFLHVDADLIVYGKTKPGATVTLDGQPLTLCRDGSFSVRFALPDGMLPLDFLGQSPDGSGKKNISLTVGRITTVFP